MALQGCAAGLAIVVLLLVLTAVRELIVVASMGSTAFTVFVFPGHRSARPRSVLGGHAASLLAGAAAGALGEPAWPWSAAPYGIAVMLATLLMLLSHTEHAPAAGTALGVAAARPSAELAAVVLVGATVLALAHELLRGQLRDLVEP